jgi:hypothetical protein
MPEIHISKQGIVAGLQNLIHGKTPSGAGWGDLIRSLREFGKRAKQDEAVVEKEAEAREPAPARPRSHLETDDVPTPSKSELQVQATTKLHQALARIGKYEEGQVINVGVEVGDHALSLIFKVELSSRQVRLSDATVTDLTNARDMTADPQVRVLYDGLLELKDQPFSLPGAGN